MIFLRIYQESLIYPILHYMLFLLDRCMHAGKINHYGLLYTDRILLHLLPHGQRQFNMGRIFSFLIILNRKTIANVRLGERVEGIKGQI